MVYGASEDLLQHKRGIAPGPNLRIDSLIRWAKGALGAVSSGPPMHARLSARRDDARGHGPHDALGGTHPLWGIEANCEQRARSAAKKRRGT